MLNENYETIAHIVDCAGGEIVGRTRFQKIVYLLTAMGLEDKFSFAYKHYGPYSDELALATKEAALLDFIFEEEKVANWGGTYSVYNIKNQYINKIQVNNDIIKKFVGLAAKSNSIELELAATAVFLSKEGVEKPWVETARRKPDKADAITLQKAKELYARFKEFSVPQPLPDIS